MVKETVAEILKVRPLNPNDNKSRMLFDDKNSNGELLTRLQRANHFFIGLFK